MAVRNQEFENLVASTLTHEIAEGVKKIKEFSSSSKISMRRLCAAANVDFSTFWRIVKGGCNPNYETMLRMRLITENPEMIPVKNSRRKQNNSCVAATSI